MSDNFFAIRLELNLPLLTIDVSSKMHFNN